MSDENAVSPMAMLPPDASPDVARSMAAEAVRLGSDVNAINAELAKRGAVPLNANSVDAAKLAKDRLFNDSDFKERYAKGDSKAMLQFNEAAARMLEASGKLTDGPASADNYDFMPALHSAGEVYKEPGKFVDSFREWSHGLSLPQNVAAGIADDHVAFVARGSHLSAEEAAALGENEASMFAKAIGSETADAQIKEASEILTRKLGRNIDLAGVVRTNGATVAMRLLHHAQDLKARSQ